MNVSYARVPGNHETHIGLEILATKHVDLETRPIFRSSDHSAGIDADLGNITSRVLVEPLRVGNVVNVKHLEVVGEFIDHASREANQHAILSPAGHVHQCAVCALGVYGMAAAAAAIAAAAPPAAVVASTGGGGGVGGRRAPRCYRRVCM